MPLNLELMSDVEQISKRAQECFRSHPAIVLGSGASATFGLPSMGELASHLSSSLEADEGDEEDAWLLVKAALVAGDHLEAALIDKMLPATLVEKIVRETWRLVAHAEKKIHLQTVVGRFRYALSSILDALFRSSNNTIDIVTTNYDRLVEFACETAGIQYAAGLLPGYASVADRSQRCKLRLEGKDVRQVRIWKVHGSMDWFDRRGSHSVYAPLFEEPSAELRPLIVTPGVSKFERILDEPFRSTVQGADDALARANGFLCFGFGFRDKQIEPRIVERIRDRNVPIVVATRTLTEEAKTFLKTKAGTEFLSLERDPSGTKVRTSQNWDGMILDDDYWSVSGFLKLVV